MLAIRGSEFVALRPVEIFRQQAVFRSVVAHGEEHGVRHVGLKPKSLRARNHFEQLDVVTPTVHTRPADFTFRGESLAEVFRNVTGLAKSLRNALCVPLPDL